MDADAPTQGVGARIRRYRDEKGISLSELARRAGVSKGYLSSLENSDGEHQRPSGETLYAIANELGVTMSDLLGRKMVTEAQPEVDEVLRQFAEAEKLPESDLVMLASIQFRGQPPQSPERWKFIYDAIKMSKSLDDDAEAAGRPAKRH